MHPRHVRLLTRVTTVLALAACGGGGDGDGGTGPGPGRPGGPGGGGSTSNAIEVLDNSYNPAATTVPVGTTVTWTWKGSASHDVVFSSTVRSEVQQAGTYQRRFSAAGTYDYQCSVHGAGMSGRVVVQ